MTKRKISEIYLDKNGQQIEPFEVTRSENEDCSNTIFFCCIATVPDGFSLSFDEPFTNFCFDFSDLSCCLENTTLNTIPNPCGDGTEISCSVDVQAVKLVGCARMLASVGSIVPNDTRNGTETGCAVSCSTTTCVNQTLTFTCDAEPPCTPCYEVERSFAEFTLSTDECDREILIAEAIVYLNFIGCNDCDCF
ncbi:hypothetical protein LC087_15720 [Bacillus carboniphilus]|uniref:Spore coat protein n=1 Tax=Bacillus carboniphilus TaxID=86663 RepID=A0ABY9JX32_9BACI|nr:hypothetical protein [Bacillus carboniphilus]WLR42170.1 hypothetical protein LC087_15720 [Bacillus carboniphilus]